MIAPLHRKKVLDLSGEPLGAGWLRRSDMRSDATEKPCDGLWRTGPDGEFRAAMVRALDAAGSVALISAFLLSDQPICDALCRAADRGVRVYALTASEQRIGTLLKDTDEDKFNRRMAEEHKQLLDRLVGKVVVRTAEHLHAKFLVIDPDDPQRCIGFLSTANFNRALTENIELGLLLEGQTAQELAKVFNWVFWMEAERELVEKGRLVALGPPPGIPEALQGETLFVTLRSQQSLRDRILLMIRQARTRLLISTFGIALEHAVTQALLDARRRGVAVTVLTRPRPVLSGVLSALVAEGVTVVGHDKLHAKAVVSDGMALVMTANLMADGLDSGFEVGVPVSGAVAEGIGATLEEWVRDFPWVLRLDACRGDHLGAFLPAGKGLRDGIIRVVAGYDQACPDQVAATALTLEEAGDPNVSPSHTPQELPQSITFLWQVVPPKLPKGARLRQPDAAGQKNKKGKKGKQQSPASVPEATGLPLYDHDGKVYFLIRSEEDLPEARRFALQNSAIAVIP